MITLSNQQPFATGGNRQVFVHPQDNSKCIKILLPHRSGAAIRTRYRFPRNLRSARNYDDNHREKTGYRYVTTEAKKYDLYAHIPRYYGCIKTDMGNGSVSQLMRNYDGTISPTLLQRIQQLATPAAAAADELYNSSISELRAFLKKNLFITRKLTPKNILCVRMSKQQERLYIIEGFGEQEFIPLVRYLTPLRRHKISRTLKAFDERLALEFSRL